MADKECNDIKFYPPTDKLGGVKKVPPCLPDVEKTPEVLRRPPVEPITSSRVIRPRQIRIYNQEVTVECTNQSIGMPVTVMAGSLSESVDLEDFIPTLVDILEFIATQELEDWIESELAAGTLTHLSLGDMTGISYETSAKIVPALYNIRTELTELAAVEAHTQLACYWENDVYQASCKDPAMAHEADHPDAVFTAVIPARTFKSYISKTHANIQASEVANSLLRCFYISDTITATCTTRPNRPIDVMEEVPTDYHTPVAPGLQKRVGSFTTAKGAFKSESSKNEANQQARDFAYGQLVCYYVNDPIFKTCEDEDARNQGLDPDVYPPVNAQLDPRSPGQTVLVPTGYIVSDFSTSHANTEATALADSLLECCYINKPIHLECPPFQVMLPNGAPAVDIDGNPIFIPANQTQSPVWSYDVEGGLFVSCTSQQEADDFAIASAQGLLECYYCNQIVLPTCVPQWVIVAATSGIQQADGSIYKLSLPIQLDGLINPYTGELEDTSQWSQDATVGIPAETFCAYDYNQAKQIATSANDTIASIRDTKEKCVFSNDELIGACAAPDPHNPTDTSLDHTGTTVSGSKYRFVSRFEADSCVSTTSKPNADDYIVIPEGTIQITANDVPTLQGVVDLTDDAVAQITKEYANTLAYNMLASLLYCVFTNPETTGVCEVSYSPESEGDKCQTPWTIGMDRSAKNLTPDSHSASNPFVVPEGMFTSTISIDDVYTTTEHFVLSNLVCDYCNEPQQAVCPPGIAQLSTALVPACIVRAESLEEANSIALAIANSMLVCMNPSMQGPPGPPGPTGADGKCTGGQCSGNCYGVYS